MMDKYLWIGFNMKHRDYYKIWSKLYLEWEPIIREDFKIDETTLVVQKGDVQGPYRHGEPREEK